jgi:hypothetical protein
VIAPGPVKYRDLELVGRRALGVDKLVRMSQGVTDSVGKWAVVLRLEILGEAEELEC